MTSVLRRVDQIPPRIRYLLVVADPLMDISTNYSSPGVSAFTVPQGTFGPIDQIADGPLAPTATFVSPSVGTLYRDLGRSLYVYDQLGAGGLQLAIYRQVMRVNGVSSEGVPQTMMSGPSLYIKTWAASGEGVIVTRTG